MKHKEVSTGNNDKQGEEIERETKEAKQNKRKEKKLNTKGKWTERTDDSKGKERQWQGNEKQRKEVRLSKLTRY